MAMADRGARASTYPTCSMYASRPVIGIAATRASSGATDSTLSTSPDATRIGRMGRVSALAMGATGERTWKSVAIIGSVPTCAAQVTANGSRSTCGRNRTRSAIDGVRRTIAAVPAKDSWKPTSHASSGCQPSIAAAVIASDVQTCEGRPMCEAASASPPIADARTAAGVAPPAIAYIAISPRTGHVALRPRIGRSAPCTILANTATLRPLSTSRWMRPVAMSAFSSCVGMPSRTPRTIPRRTAACGAGTAAFNPAV